MKLKCFCIIVMTLLLFSGCAKVVSTEQATVQVKIVDEDYSGAWMQPIYNGKTWTYIHYSAQYEITVEYNGVNYTIDNYSTYNKYCDKVGEYANGILETKTYDDGTVKSKIIGLE